MLVAIVWNSASVSGSARKAAQVSRAAGGPAWGRRTRRGRAGPLAGGCAARSLPPVPASSWRWRTRRRRTRAWQPGGRSWRQPRKHVEYRLDEREFIPASPGEVRDLDVHVWRRRHQLVQEYHRLFAAISELLTGVDPHVNHDRHPVAVGGAEYPPQLLDVRRVLIVHSALPKWSLSPLRRLGFVAHRASSSKA